MEGIGDLMIGETIPRDFGRVVIVGYNRGTKRVASMLPAPPTPFIPHAESLGGSSGKTRYNVRRMWDIEAYSRSFAVLDFRFLLLTRLM